MVDREDDHEDGGEDDEEGSVEGHQDYRDTKEKIVKQSLNKTM